MLYRLAVIPKVFVQFSQMIFHIQVVNLCNDYLRILSLFTVASCSKSKTLCHSLKLSSYVCSQFCKALILQTITFKN